MNELLDRLGSWKAFRAVVVGDFMLDQLVFGDAERLSQDAPVPVLRVVRQEDRAGGAANLCLDLAAMRGRVTALGVVGADAEGVALRAALEREGVEAGGLVVDGSRPTTVKRNLIGLAQARHPQKMFRMDIESNGALGPEAEAALLSAFDRALAGADVVCLEDYNKGVCSVGVCEEVIRRARAAGVPVLVDPASIEDYAKYAGASAITPNRNEAERATGLKTCPEASAGENAKVARALMEPLGLEAVALTLDRHGALLLTGEGLERIPTVARDVYDVTGAGDMFLAGLAAGRANGLGWGDCVRLANAASGLEVEVFGVVPIPIERIHQEILSQQIGHEGTLLTREQALVRVAAVRGAGKRVVFTNGCFDVLHAGHVALLEAAASEGDFLLVAINSDDSVRAYKGPTRPVNTQDDRAAVLGALSAVDAVVVYDEQTPVELLEEVRPDVLVKGGEYGEGEVQGEGLVTGYGGRVVRVPMRAGLSSSEILRRMGKPEAAREDSAEVHAAYIADRTRAGGSGRA